jgi:uncharacterized delta-60 repeat protein
MKTNLNRNIVILFSVLLLPLVGWGQRPGELDRSFNYGRGMNYQFNQGYGSGGFVWSIKTQPDGKIIVAGDFTSYNFLTQNRIVRLNADGSLDPTFNTGTGANNIVITTALQPDGKIIIGGVFTTFNGIARNRIARLNTDGSLDDTFNPGLGANGYVVRTTIVQPDGKIIIAGDFTTFNGSNRNRIARLNPNGSLDTTFNPRTGFNGLGTVIASTLQPDGKIIAAGAFNTYNGAPANGIARLNPDGSLDNNFNTRNTPIRPVTETVTLQPDGKIIVGGGWNVAGNGCCNFIVRLNADGIVDTTFNPGTGAGSVVYSTALQPDGKILIGGVFPSYNGTPISRIARLNANGSLDTSFNPGTGVNAAVFAINIQQDGKILIGGEFSNFNNLSPRYIARIHGYSITSGKKSINAPNLKLYPNPTSGIVTLTTSNDAESITIINSVGQLVYTTKAQTEMELNLSHLAKGVYMVQVQSSKGVSTQRLVIQ